MIRWHVFYEFHVSFSVVIIELNQNGFGLLLSKSCTRVSPTLNLKWDLYSTHAGFNKCSGFKSVVLIFAPCAPFAFSTIKKTRKNCMSYQQTIFHLLITKRSNYSKMSIKNLYLVFTFNLKIWFLNIKIQLTIKTKIS